MTTSQAIRDKFLAFFREKQHQIVPSAPLILKNDPTLMFTNSGMVQFKDYFLGNATPENPRIADSQKCLRVTGKHNDLEDVGHDTYHHTMFEMLGNWSFGDYFKQEAIDWAWELLTEVYQLPKDRLYVTVFGGDEKDKLAPDEDAKNLWKKHVSEDRILYGDKKDNFWEMGEQGPCGPCSEIHIDLRDDQLRSQIPGRDRVNQDDPQVIEIWNLVFMQFNRKADGSLEPLPNKHVDTGMGFERLVRAIEMKSSNYDTDVFRPLIQFLEKESGKDYYQDEAQGGKACIAMRVIADHIRAVAFAIADGQLPSNNKAGYVIRRILRRAVRYGYSFLGFQAPFFYKLVAIIAEQFQHIFPELKAQQAFVENVIREEETSFLRTLDNGLRMFEEIKANLTGNIIPGKTVFELYDTFGFPVDLTALIARESGLSIDMEAFEAEMQKQKERSRAAAESEKSDWVWVNEEEESRFVGYDVMECEAKILRYRKVADKKNTFYQIVIDQTPFFAESGGQIGDTGLLLGETDKIQIVDTKKENDLSILVAVQLPQDLHQVFKASVDKEKRGFTENNHSATHLLHAALRKVLGTHVQQKGSLVNDQLLRFDFSHFAKMTDEEIEQVESLVNEKIRANIALEELRSIPIEEAKAMGAMALFGEKYGNYVRTIIFDKQYSVELCGGTHVKQTGKIGFFKIVAESSIAAGVRRIEAVTALEAETYSRTQTTELQQIKELLKNPKELSKAVEQLLKEKTDLTKKIELLEKQQMQVLKEELIHKLEPKGKVNLLAQKITAPSADALKQLAFDLKNKVDNLVAILAADINGSPQIAVMISDNIVAERNLNAGSIVKELAKDIQGGGGGQAFFATAGGKNLAGLDNVINKARQLMD
ncbi:MAG TPA: alanine--tRNA ligase [Microscillaceae bacterium]|nr:alanine--tRNA ligase [Microscillaceae bacterium]